VEEHLRVVGAKALLGSTDWVGRHGGLWALLREVEGNVNRVDEQLEENEWTALERE
jgi:hypothetical protein